MYPYPYSQNKHTGSGQILENTAASFITGTSDSDENNPINFIEGGEIEPAFTATGPMESPRYRSTGKNLFNPAVGTVTANGVTCAVAADGTITLNGTATGITRFNLLGILQYVASSAACVALGYKIPIVNGKTYVGKITILSGTTNSTAFIVFVDGNGSGILEPYYSGVAATYTSALSWFSGVETYISSGETFTNFTFRLQLEQNSVATAWKQYLEDTLQITDTFAVNDRFEYHNGVGYKNGLPIPTSGNLYAHKGGMILVDYQ